MRHTLTEKMTGSRSARSFCDTRTRRACEMPSSIGASEAAATHASKHNTATHGDSVGSTVGDTVLCQQNERLPEMPALEETITAAITSRDTTKELTDSSMRSWWETGSCTRRCRAKSARGGQDMARGSFVPHAPLQCQNKSTELTERLLGRQF